MNDLTKLRGLAIGCAAVAMTSSAFAAPVSVTARADLGGNDSVHWDSKGTEFDALGASFSATSVGGLGVSVSGATESVNGFERVDQGSSWSGNFAPGDKLLWTGFGGAAQTITLQFASPVFGVGAQVQDDFLSAGSFSALLTAYDPFGAFLFSDSFSGISSGAGDNSAPFIGVKNDVENIGKIELSIVGSGSYAINQLDLNRTRGVPESGEYVTLIAALGLGLIGLVFKGHRVEMNSRN